MLVLRLELLERELRRLGRRLLSKGCKLGVDAVNIIQRINDSITMGWFPLIVVVRNRLLIAGCVIIGVGMSLWAFVRDD
jgi:hypothetical protein